MLPSRQHTFQVCLYIFQQDNAKAHAAHITKADGMGTELTHLQPWPFHERECVEIYETKNNEPVLLLITKVLWEGMATLQSGKCFTISTFFFLECVTGLKCWNGRTELNCTIMTCYIIKHNKRKISRVVHHIEFRCILTSIVWSAVGQNTIT